MTLETRTGAAGRQVPFDEGAEQQVLGSLLIDRDAIFKVADLLRVDDFYIPRNQRIYAAAQALLERRERIDPLTIQVELSRREELHRAGGQAYLHALADAVPTAVEIERYARVVRDRAILRRLLRAATASAAVGRQDEPRAWDELQHRAARTAGIALLARDGRETDRLALPRAELAHGPARTADREHHRHRRRGRAARRPDPHRRHAGDLDHGAAHEGAVSDQPREDRGDRRRLPPARSGRRRRREPRPG